MISRAFMKDARGVLYYNQESITRPPRRAQRRAARSAAPRRALLVLTLTEQRHVRELYRPSEPDTEHDAKFFKGHL